MADSNALQQIVFWNMGSLGRSTWPKIVVLATVLALCFAWAQSQAWQMTAQATALTVYESVLGTLRIACPQWSSQQAHQRTEVVLGDLDLVPLALRALGSLSGGQRQMAGLAQLLARAPRLLLLDEPTSALDLRWQLCLLQALRQHVATHNTLCIMAIHDLNLAARFCDYMLLMNEGRLLASGVPAEVLTPELLRTAYGVQARVETCSLGTPMVLAEQAIAIPSHIKKKETTCFT
jgi:iron complex transport system ATP-binding protein